MGSFGQVCFNLPTDGGGLDSTTATVGGSIDAGEWQAVGLGKLAEGDPSLNKLEPKPCVIVTCQFHVSLCKSVESFHEFTRSATEKNECLTFLNGFWRDEMRWVLPNMSCLNGRVFLQRQFPLGSGG